MSTQTHRINDYITDKRIGEIAHECWLNQAMGWDQKSYVNESIEQGRYMRALVYLNKSIDHLTALKAKLEAVKTEGSLG